MSEKASSCFAKRYSMRGAAKAIGAMFDRELRATGKRRANDLTLTIADRKTI